MVINPIVTDEKGRGSDIFSSNLENRIVYLVGEVTDEMSASLVAQLLYLAAQGDEDIQLYINSPGGSVSAGVAIYDTMQHIAPDVATICMGRAASMGAVILSGGAKGKLLRGVDWRFLDKGVDGRTFDLKKMFGEQESKTAMQRLQGIRRFKEGSRKDLVHFLLQLKRLW